MTDQEIAESLLAARSGTPLASAPEIADEAQAYRVQALAAARLGPIGGWKVGAAGPEAPVSCAPLPASTIFASPCQLDPAVFTRREVESEICFRLGADLPARPDGYTRPEVLAAIASCHPGIEILQSRFADPDAAGPLANLADFIQSGAYVLGEAIPGWRALDFAAMRVRQSIEGGAAKEAVGNPAGDMLRLLHWLADGGAAWAGGLRAGQIVTCGSWTGNTVAPSGSEVTAAFDHARPVIFRFTSGSA